ncbi:hypothetical protein CEXT_394931 [Caerostris extrusa]|uniref:Uncharacterized protein n=1 Tax=Caerostris extrusa TaxID=172846 RepID=A0AAV4XNA3_CAEEX|nr:hypothetical protein CEXT_394931 [Caerostris extrusa]
MSSLEKRTKKVHNSVASWKGGQEKMEISLKSVSLPFDGKWGKVGWYSRNAVSDARERNSTQISEHVAERGEGREKEEFLPSGTCNSNSFLIWVKIYGS